MDSSERGREPALPTDLVSMTSLARRTAPPSVVYWLPLEGAVAHFDVDRAELVRAVKDGELSSRRIICADDLAVGLSSAELLERYPRRSQPLVEGGRTAPEDRRMAEALREQAAELARVQAQLDAADRVERSLQRYADRLETELETSRRESLALARALGRAEQLIASHAAEPRRIVQLR